MKTITLEKLVYRAKQVILEDWNLHDCSDSETILLMAANIVPKDVPTLYSFAENRGELLEPKDEYIEDGFTSNAEIIAQNVLLLLIDEMETYLKQLRQLH